MANKTTTTLQMILEADDKASTKFQRLAAQVENTATKYGLQARAAEQLKAKLDALDTSTAKGAAEAARLQLQYDKLQLAMKNTEQQSARYTAAMHAEAQGGSGLVSVLQQLAVANQQLAGATGQSEAAIRKQIAALQAEAAAMKQSNDGVNAAGAAHDGLGGKLMTVAKGYIGIQAARQAWDWSKEGAAIQDISTSFDKLAASAGTTSTVLLAEMQKASKGTIANSQLMQKANTAVLLTQGRLASELPRLLTIAGASAKATGQSVNEAFDSLVLGLSRSSKMIIDNLGFTIDVGKANQDYADKLHISVDALTDQQRAIAFQNAVLVQGDQLVNTLGTSTLTNADKIAQAEAKWKNFSDTLKGFAADGVSGAIDGLNYLNQAINGNGSGDQQAQALATTAQTYEQYVAAIKAGDEAMLRSTTSQQAWLNSMGPLGQVISGVVGSQQQLVGETEILSEAQYNASQALQAYGYSAEQANTMVQGLAGQQTALTAVTSILADAEGMSAEAKGELIARTIELASASPEAASEIAGLIEQVISGEITGLQFADALAVLSAESGGASQAALDLANSLLVQNDATAGATQSTWDMIDSTYEQEMANLNAAIAAEESARFHEDLAWAADMSASSADGAAAASAYLVSVYGLEIGQVNELTAATNQLNLARAGKQGNAAGRAAGGLAKRITNPDTGGAMGYHQRRVDSAERAERARGGGGGRKSGGGSGKKAGKSESVKQAEKEQKELQGIQTKADKAVADHQKKREDLEKKHVDKLQAIDDEYHQKALEAERKFNSDKFQERASFNEGLLDLDQDLYDQAKAASSSYWDESQKMAQAGHAEQAAEYYAAGLALTDMQAQHAQAIRDRQAEIAAEEDATEKARLEERLRRERELYAEQEQLAKDKVEAVKNGGDQIEQERQDAIAKENADYAEAQDSLKADFAETLDEIKLSYADMGAAARETADAIIAAAAAATDAINSIPGIPANAGDGSSGEPIPVEARAAGGPFVPGRPYLVGEEGPELVIPRGAGTVIPADRTAAIRRNALPTVPGAVARSTGGRVGAPTSSTTQTTQNTTINVDLRGASGPIAGAKEQLRQFIRDEIKAQDRGTGGGASNKIKMGGR